MIITNNPVRSILIILVSSLSLFIADRVTKLHYYNSGNYQLNTGIALSFFNGSPFLGFLLAFVGIIALLVILIKFRRLYRISTTFCLIWFLVITGALSNILDRIFFGGVIDFISLPGLPTFNIADIFITGGIVIIALIYITGKDAVFIQSRRESR